MSLRPSEKSGMCGICSAGCGVVVSYDQEGRIAAVRADDASPFGMICRVGEHSPEIIYSKDRILYPMRRTARKGVTISREFRGMRPMMKSLRSSTR